MEWVLEWTSQRCEEHYQASSIRPITERHAPASIRAEGSSGIPRLMYLLAIDGLLLSSFAGIACTLSVTHPLGPLRPRWASIRCDRRASRAVYLGSRTCQVLVPLLGPEVKPAGHPGIITPPPSPRRGRGAPSGHCSHAGIDSTQHVMHASVPDSSALRERSRWRVCCPARIGSTRLSRQPDSSLIASRILAFPIRD